MVQIWGVDVPWVEWTVTNNSHFTADRFDVLLPVSKLPAQFPLDWWVSTDKAECEIKAGLEDSYGVVFYTSLIVGVVDDIDYDPNARTIRLTGRDYSSAFLDNKTFEQFRNQTASQIAQTLAARRGLSCVAQATTTLAGTYYEIDHVGLTTGQTEWDLLTWLAQKEQFDVWVVGRTLYFQPPIEDTALPYLVQYRGPSSGAVASGTSMRPKFKRSMTLAKDIIVNVRSWNQKQETAFTVTAKAIGAHKTNRSSPNGDAQIYEITKPNLSKAEAQDLANKRLAELTRHEFVYNDELPGDLTLTTRQIIKTSGFGLWDALYYVDQVERRFNLNDGFKMTFRAKNHPTRSMVAA